MKSIVHWLKNNIVAIALVFCFAAIYAASQITGTAFEHWGSTSMEYLHSEYFRWLTCIFLHFNFVHIFFNSIALLAIGSLISPFIGKWKTLFLFVLCGALAEIACSIVISYSEPVYAGGSSGGIFALIGVFTVCYLRFPQNFYLRWYRLDIVIVAAFFIFANDNIGSFMTHIFGFAAGIIISFLMVLTGWIDNKERNSIRKGIR